MACAAKTLSRVSEVTLPPHESDKTLANNKTIGVICNPFGTERDVHHSSDPPKITAFTEVPQDTVDKIIRNSPTKSCILDPWTIIVNVSLIIVKTLGNYGMCCKNPE